MDTFTLDKIEFSAVRLILSRFAATSLGKRLCLRITPSRNPEIIAKWQGQTAQMIDAIVSVGLPPLAGVTDITQTLARAVPAGPATGEDYADIASTLASASNVRGYLLSLADSMELLIALGAEIDEFAPLVEAIAGVVATDGSIRDDASPRLSQIRREVANLGREIHDVMYGYLRRPEVTRLLQHATVTLHGDRYVLPVKAIHRGRLPGVVHRLSGTGATVFVEPDESVELNNRLADRCNDERAEIQLLLDDLAIKVTARADEITATLRVLSQVDLIASKAQYAYQFEMTCPKICERGRVELHQACHPLLIEQAFQDKKAGNATHEVVPLDIRLGADFDLLIITGSNTGGKTVTLKTLALMAVMAQSGMHIPARRGSSLPVFRNIFIDIGDEQSLQQSLSTFGAHIKRIRYILNKTDKNSLVLLDELGSGTDPDEGGAIGQAVLDEFRRIGCLGAITTHLSVLKAYAFSHERVDNASVEFDTKTLSPTYRLHIGTPGESHAITVASRLGVNPRVIEAARKHLSGQGKQFRKAIQATGIARKSAEQARTQAVEAHLAAQDTQQLYEAKLADLHELQGQFQIWLARLTQLSPGDEIYIPSLKKSGHLVRLELHNQLAVVDAGSIQAEVPLSELMPDLGQEAVRQQIDKIQADILAQSRSTEADRTEANRLRAEYHRSLEHQKTRARQFDTWLGFIARLKVGQDVPIAAKPGKAVLIEVDLPGLRAKVRTGDGREIELSIQDLYPQSGPFAPRPERPARGRGAKGRHAKDRAPKGQPGQAQSQAPAKPITRRSADSKAARSARAKLLTTEPGQQVFVVPFNRKATLIRINKDKDKAVVQSGIFEMELPLADIEPIKES